MHHLTYKRFYDLQARLQGAGRGYIRKAKFPFVATANRFGSVLVALPLLLAKPTLIEPARAIRSVAKLCKTRQFGTVFLRPRLDFDLAMCYNSQKADALRHINAFTDC